MCTEQLADILHVHGTVLCNGHGSTTVTALLSDPPPCTMQALLFRGAVACRCTIAPVLLFEFCRRQRSELHTAYKQLSSLVSAGIRAKLLGPLSLRWLKTRPALKERSTLPTNRFCDSGSNAKCSAVRRTASTKESSALEFQISCLAILCT